LQTGLGSNGWNDHPVPQFTPHNEALHLARLFEITDKLLGAERYAKMNAPELFLLACGLYAHDWGMSVGREELDYLMSGASGEINAEVFTTLEMKRCVLREFAEKQGIRAAGTAAFPALSDEQLKPYIRQTHAFRSGARAKTFFDKIDKGVAEALELVSRGTGSTFPIWMMNNASLCKRGYWGNR